MPFALFDHLDEAIIQMEKHDSRAARLPTIWPSEASATLTNPEECEGCGKCRRAVYLRMTGATETNPPDSMACQIMRIGRAMETEIAAQMHASDLFVASGVRYWVDDVKMSFECDAVVRNPDTGQGVLAEIKSFDGYFAEKDIIKEGKPKLEHILQLCIYINELRTGKRLKQAIQSGLKEREENPEKAAKHRNRIEAKLDNLSMVDDGLLAGKLLYVNRTGRNRREFDISIYADSDGFHYPAVEAVPWKVFTVESIYDRALQSQAYYQRALDEAKKRVVEGLRPDKVWPEGQLVPEVPYRDIEAGTANPDVIPTQEKAVDDYWKAVQQELVDLPDTFLPPVDFQYKYGKDKVEKLYAEGKIPKDKYFKGKKHHSIIGAWQCLLPESLVEMSDGSFIPIADTKVGQTTARGRITDKRADYTKKEVVKVKPYNLLPLYLTADHEWKTADGSFIASEKLIKLQKTRYLPVKDGGGIKEGSKSYKYGRPFYHELTVPFDTEEVKVTLSEEELFIVGLWLAEGHFAHRNEKKTKWYKVGFTLNPNEGYLVDKIAKWASKFTNKDGNPATITDRIKTDKRTGYHYRVVIVNSQDAAAFIEKYAGCGGAKLKSIPVFLMKAELWQQEALLNGLKEGDGCTTKMRATRMHVYTSVSKQLALQVQRLLWRSGKVASIVSQESSSGFRNGKTGTAYHVRWYDGSSWASRIKDGVFYTAIHSISRNIRYTGLVYDLTIEETHEIPTASGVVHNCRYCNFKSTCVGKEYPELRYLLLNSGPQPEELQDERAL